MRVTSCGQLGEMVSKAFLKESWLAPPNGRRIPVIIEVYGIEAYGREAAGIPENALYYHAKLGLDLVNGVVFGDQVDYVNYMTNKGAYSRSGSGSSPEIALMNLVGSLKDIGRESSIESRLFEIVKVVDRRHDKSKPLALKTDEERELEEDKELREKMERNLEEDPELLELLS